MFRFIIFRVCLSIAPTKWVFPTLLSHSIVMGWHYLRQSNQFSAFFTRLSAQKRHFKEQWYFAKWEFNNEYETYLQRRKTTLQSIDSTLQEQQNEEEGRKKLTTKKKESTLANTISALRQLSYFCWMPTMSSVARSFFLILNMQNL